MRNISQFALNPLLTQYRCGDVDNEQIGYSSSRWSDLGISVVNSTRQTTQTRENIIYRLSPRSSSFKRTDSSSCSHNSCCSGMFTRASSCVYWKSVALTLHVLCAIFFRTTILFFKKDCNFSQYLFIFKSSPGGLMN